MCVEVEEELVLRMRDVHLERYREMQQRAGRDRVELQHKTDPALQLSLLPLCSQHTRINCHR